MKYWITTLALLLGTVHARGVGDDPPARQSDPGKLVTYETTVQGHRRVFDFDGRTPFVNPVTRRSDVAAIGFDGGGLTGTQIDNAGSRSGHVVKVRDPQDGDLVTRVRLFPTDSGEGGYRSQLNSYPFEPYRTYVYDLQFKLDVDWNFNMQAGDGLLWQVKGMPRPGQWGNPSMALNLHGKQLALSVKYPLSAMRAATWPVDVRWGNGDYVHIALPTRPVQAGRYHRVQILFAADDRPAVHGGQGRIQAWFDGEPWLSYVGPTLHPDQQGWHRMDFGWYQWEGRPQSVRTVFFRTSHLYLLP